MTPTLKRQDHTFSWGGKCFPLLFEDLLAESLRRYPFLDTFWISDGEFLRVYWSKIARAQATEYGENILGATDRAQQYCQLITQARDRALGVDTLAVTTFALFEKQIEPFKEFLYTYIALDPEFTNDFLETKNDPELLAFLGEQKNLFREDINRIFFDQTGPYQAMLHLLAVHFSVSFSFIQSLSLQQVKVLFEGESVQSVQDVFCIHVSHGAKEYVFDRETVQAVMEGFAPSTVMKDSQLKGVSASTRGVFRGVVKKVILDYENFSEELAKENISSDKDFVLVADHTTPELVPLMKKSIAIVTDMGGILSHAAITARELGIPCVIGTENASLVLKDGDIVEVDANNGIVKKI